jgi:hypothetical protein
MLYIWASYDFVCFPLWGGFPHSPCLVAGVRTRSLCMPSSVLLCYQIVLWFFWVCFFGFLICLLFEHALLKPFLDDLYGFVMNPFLAGVDPPDPPWLASLGRLPMPPSNVVHPTRYNHTKAQGGMRRVRAKRARAVWGVNPQESSIQLGYRE